MIEFVKNFWCQKVLPLVYTDALSYYEMLGKFVGKLNEVISNVNNLNENTVFSVNGIAPTGGNVNVGTVKSVNGSMPDASGNVNLPQASGVTSVDGVGADSSGNVQLNAVKHVNSSSPDGNGNVNITAANVGAIPNSNGSVGTNLLADKSVTKAKVADEIVYMPEAAVDTASKLYITKAFGGIFNWIYGTGYILEIDGPEFNSQLDTFWEAVIYNSELRDLTIKFTNLPAVYDTRNGTNLGGTSQITLTKYQAIKLKKISSTAMLILPA